jgi:hypothetical protein
MANLTLDNAAPRKNFRPTTTIPRAKARLAGKPNPTLKVTKKNATGPVFNGPIGSDDQNLPQLEDGETYTAEATLAANQNITLSY